MMARSASAASYSASRWRPWVTRETDASLKLGRMACCRALRAPFGTFSALSCVGERAHSDDGQIGECGFIFRVALESLGHQGNRRIHQTRPDGMLTCLAHNLRQFQRFRLMELANPLLDAIEVLLQWFVGEIHLR